MNNGDPTVTQASSNLAPPTLPLRPHRHAHQDTSALTSGAMGREIFFRPSRYGPEALAPLDVTVQVPGLGADQDVRLRNLSQSGLALIWPETSALPSDGDVLRGVAICVDGHIVTTVDAKVCSLQPGRIVGL